MVRMIDGIEVRPASEVELDTSLQHPALTPLMRRLADEYWAIVKSRAEEAGLPLRSARLAIDHDIEDVVWVLVKVRVGAGFEETRAFHRSIGPDVERWIARMDTESREAMRRLILDLPWMASPSFARNGV